ncbi:unnamed protein product [Sphagnum jensenii]|uniref:PH domain-containing protein n=1 Tax=Sphagnum jensenii TaxID=128206 RepID=A0ABP0VE81_9BRYO
MSIEGQMIDSFFVSYVSFRSRTSKFIDERRVYNETEFYLPQLAHLIIHLDDTTASSITSALENLALTLVKTSIHTAQQLNFILIAALEDYQPEDSLGIKNSNANINRFFRCARLLKRIEQMVVFRQLVSSVRDSYLSNNQVLQGFGSNDSPLTKDDSEIRQSGFLLYKRVTRKSMFSSKPWKRRFFSVHYRVLSCYRNADDDDPLRSILLPGCVLDKQPIDIHYSWGLSLYNKTTYIRFNLRALDQASYNSWVAFLERFQDREVRRYFLRRDMSTLVIPPFCYLPLCTSLTPFRCVLRALPRETHAFNTKARCPALMLFEVEEHPYSADTAGFLGLELPAYEESEIKETTVQAFTAYDKKDTPTLKGAHSSDQLMPAERVTGSTPA